MNTKIKKLYLKYLKFTSAIAAIIIFSMALTTYVISIGTLGVAIDEPLDTIRKAVICSYYFCAAIMGAMVLFAFFIVILKKPILKWSWRRLKEGTRPGDTSYGQL